MPKKSKFSKSRINNLKKGKNEKVQSENVELKVSGSNIDSVRDKIATDSVPTCVNKVVKGNFHQANFFRYKSTSGLQCVSNVFCSILFNSISNIEQWTSETLDFILDKGNDMYSEIRANQLIQNEYLLVQELPRSPNIFNYQFEVEISENSIVGLFCTDIDLQDDHVMPLYEAIQSSLFDFRSCVITFGNNSFCVIKKDAKFFVFDSHSRNIHGEIIPNGTSVLLEKNNIMEVYNQCMGLFTSLNLPLTSQFEVTGINVISCSPSNSESSVNSVIKDIANMEDDLIMCSEQMQKFIFKSLKNENMKYACLMLGLPLPDYINDDRNISKPLLNPKITNSIVGDGNCFFRCISFSLTGSEQYHRKIRLANVTHMKDNSENYSPLLRFNYKSINDYIQNSKMRLLGTWAIEIEIQAMCDLLNMDIYTFTNCRWIKYSPFSGIVDMNCAIYLNHKNQNH